ncbi:hypothetical protein SAMN05661099_2494 [Daejeonella lutea]|uniref:Uncharacterized protein n=1 Tax=Daejeonella lutea TaxID=572036 RepID=A0A1T5DPR1_9SPHI|nr:hypothetical protein SAMN05661099_2494 [Daejeonella lutea]
MTRTLWCKYQGKNRESSGKHPGYSRTFPESFSELSRNCLEDGNSEKQSTYPAVMVLPGKNLNSVIITNNF